MEHLACFMAGTVRRRARSSDTCAVMVAAHFSITSFSRSAQLVMGAEGARAERYMRYAEELAETCYQARYSPLNVH